jgi:ribose transport system permease protein
VTAEPGPAAVATTGWRSPAAWRRRVRDQPAIPLLVLLAALVALLQVVQPGIVKAEWVSSTIKFATPLAILAACQTLAMLTGGIDLSVASIASLAGYVAATQVSSQGDAAAIAIALAAAALVGLVNGVGIGLFRVQPLIMTLGMSLVVTGFLTVYQVLAVASAASLPDVIRDVFGGSIGLLPTILLVYLPVAAIILFGLRRSGYGRLLYAVGDNPPAARLAGVRIGRVLVVVYVISGILAGIAGLAISGIAGAATIALGDPYLLPSVAAVVIGGTSIFGGRGGYLGSIIGALILTVLVSLLTVLQAPQPVRQIVYGAIILVVAAAYTRVTSES